MFLGIVGYKCGMTRLFDKSGVSTPVSIIRVEPNIITQVKTISSDGYSAIQVTTGIKKRSRVNKPDAGHFSSAGVEPGVGLWEFRVDSNNFEKGTFKTGEEINISSVLSSGIKVDVTAISKGKGFQGSVKRHNFSMQDATHGNSLSHRAHGSTGQNQNPGRVLKNKKMAGHMGHVRTTIQSLKIVKLDLENKLCLIKGSIPGPVGNTIIVIPSKKCKV